MITPILGISVVIILWVLGEILLSLANTEREPGWPTVYGFQRWVGPEQGRDLA